MISVRRGWGAEPLRRAGWYAARPAMYRELGRRVRGRLLREHRDPRDSADARRAATAWCEQRALDTGEALARITGRSDHFAVRDRFPEVFAMADAAARAVPHNMGGPGDLDLLFHLAEHVQARTALETGVAYGWSSLVLLLSVTRRGGRLLSTDVPYVAGGSDRWVGAIVPPDLAASWTLVRRPDRDALPPLLRRVNAADVFHYDSDKRAAARAWAYRLVLDRMRPGAAFVSDDVGDNLAFRELCDERGLEPVIVRTAAYLGAGGGQTWEKYVGVVVV